MLKASSWLASSSGEAADTTDAKNSTAAEASMHRLLVSLSEAMDLSVRRHRSWE